MDSIYTRKKRVEASMCGSDGKISMSAAFALFQDIASEHADTMGMGFQAMARRGSFWLTVRTRVRFYRRPEMTREIDVSTWPAAPGVSRCDRFYRASDGEEVLIEGRTEWCVYDVEGHAVRPTAQAGYPEGFVYAQERALDAPYARFRHDFAEADCALRYHVRPSDIDVGQHMNNVAYLRLISDSFSVAQTRAMKLQEAEILFCLPCFEGDALDVMRRETADGWEFGVRRPDGRYAALALMRAEK